MKKDYSFHMLGALNMHPDQEKALEQLHTILSKKAGCGITIVGNHLTLRYGSDKDGFHQVTMLIHEIVPKHWHDANHIDDPSEELGQ